MSITTSSNPPQKPHIVLLPGAWHIPSSLSPLTSYLTTHNYTVHTLSLPSVNALPPKPDFTSDVSSIASTLSTLADAGHDIILFMHSYAGIPGSSACQGLLRSQREKEGKKGGVVHLIYCAAFMLPLGASLLNAIGNAPAPWFEFPNEGLAAGGRHAENKERLTVIPRTPRETFYNSIKDKDAVEKLVGWLRPMSYAAFSSGVGFAAWDECKATYILCGEDGALPVEGQRGMCDAADEAGAMVSRVVLEEADHTPFWSAGDEVGRVVRRSAGEVVD